MKEVLAFYPILIDGTITTIILTILSAIVALVISFIVGLSRISKFKSIRVADRFRGKGNGIKVINHIIGEAKKLNIKKISLETGAGSFFESARKLFYKCGFKPCKPFAHYKKDIDACYMTLLLSN